MGKNRGVCVNGGSGYQAPRTSHEPETEPLLECVVTPMQSVVEYNAAIDAMLGECWFLHQSQDGKYYFDRQENLTKMLQGIAAIQVDIGDENRTIEALEDLGHEIEWPHVPKWR